MTNAENRTYREYIALHQERAEQALETLDMLERRVMERGAGALDTTHIIDACLRLLIDVSLKKQPSTDLAAVFLRYVLLVPIHMRVPLVNAVISCCEVGSDADLNLMGLRKKFHALVNKVGAIHYEMAMHFADWSLRDPAQLEMFAAPEKPAGQTIDDGGVWVDSQTGEVIPPPEEG
jgi:hypothetical protein